MVAFRDLWYRHPANNSTTYPCIAPFGLTNMEGLSVRQGNPVFGNQCAIRMGVCLKNAGVSPGSLRLTTCSVHPAEEMHIIRADDLARGLAGSSIEGIGRSYWCPVAMAESRKGDRRMPALTAASIICFRNATRSAWVSDERS